MTFGAPATWPNGELPPEARVEALKRQHDLIPQRTDDERLAALRQEHARLWQIVYTEPFRLPDEPSPDRIELERVGKIIDDLNARLAGKAVRPTGEV